MTGKKITYTMKLGRKEFYYVQDFFSICDEIQRKMVYFDFSWHAMIQKFPRDI